MGLYHQGPAHSLSYVVSKVYSRETNFSFIGESFISHVKAYIENEINVLNKVENEGMDIRRIDKDLAALVMDKKQESLDKSEIESIRDAYSGVVKNLVTLKSNSKDIYSSKKTFDEFYNFLKGARDVADAKFQKEVQSYDSA